MCDTGEEDFLMDCSREICREISLYDADTTDSGFHDEQPENAGHPHDLEKLIGSPLHFEDLEDSVCFSPVKADPESTPGKGWLSTKKKRLLISPDAESPSRVAARGLKKLKIFGLDDEVQGESVKNAVEKSEAEGDLIGDFSKAYCLPLAAGSHPDLKAVSVDTIRDIIERKYDHVLTSYKIIDSRYPYEYQGGHIIGAVNIYQKEECLNLLREVTKPKDERHVLIFHCEFSKERGPNMIRHLRQEDRLKNGSSYPELTYPEIYVLEGGYKKFFQKFPELCEPMDYKQMLHPEHLDDLRFFRKKSKTFNDDCRTSTRKTGKLTVRRFFSTED